MARANLAEQQRIVLSELVQTDANGANEGIACFSFFIHPFLYCIDIFIYQAHVKINTFIFPPTLWRCLRHGWNANGNILFLFRF